MTDTIEITDLDAIPVVAASDVLYIIDVSQGDAGSCKVTVENLFAGAFTALELSDITFAADGILYFGDPTTNGSYRVRRDGTYSTIILYENRVSGSWSVVKAEVLPSGDATGATDYAAIQHCLDTYECTQLLDGTYSTNDTLSITTAGTVLAGTGKTSTWIDRVDAVAAVLYCYENVSGQIMLRDLTFSGGLHGVHLDNTPHVEARGVRCYYNGSGGSGHGWFCENGCWSIRLSQCELVGAQQDGFHALAGATDGNGNDVVLTDCSIRINGEAGVYWGANKIKISGCQFENNVDCGVHLRANDVAASGASIVDNRFENEGTGANGAIFLDAVATASPAKFVQYTAIRGNYLYSGYGGDLITADGSAGDVDWLTIDNTNVMSSSGEYLLFGTDVVRLSNIYVRDPAKTTITNPEESEITTNYQRKVITEYISVDCSDGGTAQEATLVVLPTGTIIHDVMCYCSQTFNGSGTTSFEVGIATAHDKYIDEADFTPLNAGTYKCTNDGTNNGNYADGKTAQYCTSAQTLIAYWTNDGGTPTTGKVTVCITYTLASVSTRAST